MGGNNTADKARENAATQAQQMYTKMQQPSALENEFGGLRNQFTDAYNQSVGQGIQDYGNIMQSYKDFAGNQKPTSFGYQTVTAKRPDELGEAYGYLREAAPGYREFANTGGYSDADVANLRARGIDPIRASYGNTMMELDRARSLGGDSGSPNYIAAVASANRQLPQQLADAEQNVNAKLAEDIRSGKLAGLAGLSGIGSTMGGLSSDEANRMLTAATANQRADLEAQQLSEQSRQNAQHNILSSLEGQRGLYGTAPGMATAFGNQALDAWRSSLGAESNRNQLALSALNPQISAYSAQQGGGSPWWKKALGAAAAGAATYFTGGLAAPAAGMIYSGIANAGGGNGNENWQYGE